MTMTVTRAMKTKIWLALTTRLVTMLRSSQSLSTLASLHLDYGILLRKNIYHPYFSKPEQIHPYYLENSIYEPMSLRLEQSWSMYTSPCSHFLLQPHIRLPTTF